MSDFKKIFQEKFVEAGKKHKNIVLFCPDDMDELPVEIFSESFNERFFNFGLAEKSMFLAAVAFAVRGKMPFISCLSETIVKSFVEVKHAICLPNLNIKIVGIGDEVKILEDLPNMKIFCPRNEEELLEALRVMVTEYGPMYLRLSC